jgi:hypothetical protein
MSTAEHRSDEAPDGGTPNDDPTPAGDTPEAHDEIVPEDLPKGHPGRAEAERQAREGDGFARGNV